MDWRKFLTTDKAFKFDPTIEDFSKNAWPYISVAANKEASGYAMLGDRIAYGDISGDGKEEALVSLFSGGTAGNLGVLLFRAGAEKPELVAAFPGYKLGGVFDGGVLTVTQPLYAGFEPNCCASGFKFTRYKIVDSKLVDLGTISEGIPAARPYTVQKFFEYLNDKKFKDAYAFLSPTYQHDQPFEPWKAGYKNTTNIVVSDVRQRANGLVSALVKGTDSTAKGLVSQTYHVVVSLTWDTKAGQWLLDTATVDIAAAKLTGKLQYPSSFIPALEIFARDTESGDVFSTDTKQNQNNWSLVVPSGTYQVFAYVLNASNTELAAGYSEFVTCGLKVSCPSHKLIMVKAESGKTTSGVDVSDWYAPVGTFPPRP